MLTFFYTRISLYKYKSVRWQGFLLSITQSAKESKVNVLGDQANLTLTMLPPLEILKSRSVTTPFSFSSLRYIKSLAINVRLIFSFFSKIISTRNWLPYSIWCMKAGTFKVYLLTCKVININRFNKLTLAMFDSNYIQRFSAIFTSMYDVSQILLLALLTSL